MPSNRPKSTSVKVKPRKIVQPTYKSFRMSKQIKQPKVHIVGGFRLFVLSLKILYKNKRLFGGILVITFLLNLILVKGLSNASNLTDLKGSLDGIFTGNTGKLTSGFALFAVLVGSSGAAPTEVAGLYQTVLFVVTSLVFIWALRQTSGQAKPPKVRIRDAFYKSMYPIIPFILVLLVIGLQLLPLVSANFLYGTVITSGLAVTMLEKLLWLLLIFLLIILSLYMISSSVFALYIVTLPDMTPMQALRSARELVRFRRWTIIRKLLLLPVCLLVLGALLVIPLIILSPGLAEWVFYILGLIVLPVVHSYIYQLYRKLL